MTKRTSLVEKVIQLIDARIAGLQYARDELIRAQQSQAAPRLAVAKKRTATAQEG